VQYHPLGVHGDHFRVPSGKELKLKETVSWGLVQSLSAMGLFHFCFEIFLLNAYQCCGGMLTMNVAAVL
jgi:hypothetical protein